MNASLTPEMLFAQEPLALAVVDAVRSTLADDDYALRTTNSQVAFRRRRGFAYVWVPGRYLRRPRTPVVLSIALDEPIESPRFSAVAHPSARIWMHHLDVPSLDVVDDEVAGWLRLACARAA